MSLARVARAICLLALVALAGCRASGPVETKAVAVGRERISASQAAHLERTFDEILETLQGNYVYGRQRGTDWSALRTRYRGRIGRISGVAEFATLVREALAEVGDPDVQWQSRDERIRAELEYSTRYEGIGTYIGFRDRPVPRVLILEVIPGSPAERAGLRSHDAITSIDGVPVRPGESTTVAQRIRGPRGTAVRLEVVRPGAGRSVVSVTRDRVDLSGVRLSARYARLGTLAYILVPRAAPEDLTQQIRSVLGELGQQRPLGGLVLDLRICSTGSFPLAELLAFFSNGEHGATYTAQGEETVRIEGKDENGSQRLALALIVGPDTEGAAEIFAAALQARRRAVVVGRRTPGSVEREQQFGLVDGSRLWLPVWSYRAPGGTETGLQGVVPDVTVEADWDEVSEVVDPVRAAAAAALGVKL